MSKAHPKKGDGILLRQRSDRSTSLLLRQKCLATAVQRQTGRQCRLAFIGTLT